MRLIDADALMVELMDSDLDHLQRDDWREVIQIVADAPTITFEPHWIPVTERLPEADGYGHYFLVCLENGVVRINGFSRIHTTRCPDGFYYETDHFTWRQNQNKVVAWMPLPEPFKGVTT